MHLFVLTQTPRTRDSAVSLQQMFLPEKRSPRGTVETRGSISFPNSLRD